MLMSDTAISLRRATLTFRSPAETVVALKDADITVSRGEFVGLLGVSGSGKTSLVNVIAGLQSVTSGEVLVLGHNLVAMSARERAALRLDRIGVVFQDHNLIPELSVRENVALPLRARAMRPKAADAEADRWLDRVGLPDLGDRMPAQLSGGQRQRVGIARALVGGREILLADEPTGSLDSDTSSSIFELLASLATSGATVVSATHDPGIHHWATRTVRMSDGSVLDLARPEFSL